MTRSTFEQLYFEKAPARALTVHVAEAEIKRAFEYLPASDAVKAFLSPWVAASILMGCASNFPERLMFGFRSETGPMKAFVVQVTEDLTFRVHLEWNEGHTIDDNHLSLEALMGTGDDALVSFWVRQHPEAKAMQTFLDAKSGNLEAMLSDFFTQSMQLPTGVRLAGNDNMCGGLIWQKIPEDGGKATDIDPEAWHRVELFANSVKDEELTTLDANDINGRLFWEEKPVITQQLTPTYRCECGVGIFEKILRQLGEVEAMKALEESPDHTITMTCGFCHQSYVLSQADVEQLFLEPTDGVAVN